MKPSEKIKTCQIQSQSYVDCLFWHRRYYPQRIFRKGQTVNCCYYLEVLRQLRENIRRKRPGLWTNKYLFVLDKASAPRTFFNSWFFLLKPRLMCFPSPLTNPILLFFGSNTEIHHERKKVRYNRRNKRKSQK